MMSEFFIYSWIINYTLIQRTLNEIQKLKNAIKKEKEKQEEHNKNLRSQGEIVCLMR